MLGKTDFKIKTVTRDKKGNDQGINSTCRYNNYKYIFTQHKTHKYIKQIVTVIKGEIGSHTTIRNFQHSTYIIQRENHWP